MSLADRIGAIGVAGQWIAGLLAALLMAGLLLALSAAGNVWLLRKTWTAKADCRAQMEQAARIAIEDERKRADNADAQARGIAADTRSDTRKGAAQAQRNTDARESKLGQVAVTGGCLMPAGGMPSIQPAIDEANAAAGD